MVYIQELLIYICIRVSRDTYNRRGMSNMQLNDGRPGRMARGREVVVPPLLPGPPQRHGCSNSIQRVSFGNVTNPRARPQILASNGLATKVIENALCPRALTIPYMVLNFAENDGSAMELSNGTGCEDLSSWWRLVTTIVERSFVRFSESGCSNREVLP